MSNYEAANYAGNESGIFATGVAAGIATLTVDTALPNWVKAFALPSLGIH